MKRLATNSHRILMKRTLIYLAGFILLTFGQRSFVESGLGAGSLDALCVGLSSGLGLTAGMWIWISAVLMMLVSAALERRRPNSYVLISSCLFGILFDFWGMIYQAIPRPEGFGIPLILFVLGLFFGPLGTAVYFRSGFSKSALDEFVMSFSIRFGWSVRASKTIIECITILSALFVGGPIGLGTVISGFLYGPILQAFLEPFHKKRLRKVLDEKRG